MARTILYIACSLDGFIAKPDGNLDWLTSVPDPQTGDYGYAALLERINTIIMGRKTYDIVLGLSAEWFYDGFNTYVVTTNENLEIKSPDTCLLTENIKGFVEELKRTSEKDIWLVGGGELNTMFINEGLLDEMIITIIPKMIGDGIRLFAGHPAETSWRLISTQSFDTGLVNLTYEKSE